MKRIYKKWSLVLFSALTLTACNDDFDALNTDPDRPEEVPSAYLLTSAQKGLMDGTLDEWNNGRFGMLWSQYWAQQEYTAESRFKLRDGSINNMWSEYYAGLDGSTVKLGGVMDLVKIMEQENAKPEEGRNENMIAAARILKVWMMQNITDIWGNVPYSEAFQAESGISNPVYDSQELIYADLLKELKESFAQLDPAGKLIDGDVVYSGDPSSWQKFANALRLRVAIRMADVDEATARAEIQDVLQSGVLFSGVSDEASFPYMDSQPNNNPLSQYLGGRSDFSLSETMVNEMLPKMDPRLPIYANPAVDSDQFVGRPYGQTDDEAAQMAKTSVSQPGPGWVGALPGVYISYSEQQFILAEAVLRGFIAGDALTYMKSGVRSSMEFWGVDVSEADVYVDAVSLNQSTWKNDLGYEKWVALYGQGQQGWIEWRRLDFGILILPVGGIHEGALSDDMIPVRVTYPTNEQTLNRINWTNAIQDQSSSNGWTGDRLDGKVWWDIN
ncbi:SusD/RagB family nutrient-binding outer membrane lipoprotein [Aureibacter tunicatorum]|uniref:SusD/RagB family nutrient-binding outer membrane lipoprotein n=1 Tax=Aureibacter tunicatorum TaxID=866807 RepID=A0AAE3XNV7_9BACT|nr:SusD/RagB family nutrient-binding outer membrane lipoprotein [Aureibacter tunicatorum]MDR6240377.1 hypothetical protein [Aureibacter tunicatorum]BDD05742.1 hypothetical protein AUTU_32250 [Aureibacter tunicatorum]